MKKKKNCCTAAAAAAWAGEPEMEMTLQAGSFCYGK